MRNEKLSPEEIEQVRAALDNLAPPLDAVFLSPELANDVWNLLTRETKSDLLIGMILRARAPEPAQAELLDRAAAEVLAEELDSLPAKRRT